MNNRRTVKLRLTAFLMCALLMLASVFPLVLENERVDAADTVTVYFDTGGGGSSANGWSKSMSAVFCHYTSTTDDSNDSGVTPLNFERSMTLTNITSLKDPTNGKIFKLEVPSEYVGCYISFSPYIGNQKGWYRTSRRSPIKVKQDIVVFATSTEQDGYWQSWYTEMPTVTDYAGKKFKIANLTGAAAEFELIYYSEDGSNIKTITKNDDPNLTIPARSKGVEFTVPSITNSGDTPYARVKIIRKGHANDTALYDANDTVFKDTAYQNITGTQIKDYDLGGTKCIGKTLRYGITEYAETSTYVDDADGKTLSFTGDNFGTLTGVTSKVLYLSKDFSIYPNASDIKVVVGTTEYLVEAVTTGGNASYVTTSGITVPQDTFFSIKCSYTSGGQTYTDVYNLYWNDTSKDLCVLSNKDTAEVKDTRTVQSTDNELVENGVTYKYMTTKADFYDYQYDYNSASDSSYTYKVSNISNNDYNGNHPYVAYSDSVVFTNNNMTNWSDVYAYFFDSGDVGPAFPGTKMTYIGMNTNNEDQYVIKVPDGATKVIFSNGSDSNQTKNITLSDNTGYYATSSTSPVDYGSWSLSGTASERGNAKRPYLAINEALSASDYAAASSNYPLYLGQFWLPIKTDDQDHNESSEIYSASTVAQRAAHNNDSDYYCLDGSGRNDYSKHFGFGNELRNFDWSANLAFRYESQPPGAYEPYNAVVQGLVSKTLVNGKLMSNDGTHSIPYFDLDWWNGTTFTSGNNFTTSQGTTVAMMDYIKPYENYDFPFFETNASDISFKNFTHNGHLISNTDKDYSGKYYVFNSEKNSVYVNSSTGTLDKHYNDSNHQVMDNYGNGSTTNSEKGLFPFNQQADSNSANLHYGFGVKFSIDFYLPENGTLNGNTDGVPVTFTFQGDDDVWVFLDNKLILDMGGAHKNSIGEINFADKNVFIGAAARAGASVAVTSSTKPQSSNVPFSDLGITASDLTEGKHKITMYYLERGMLNSNLYVMYNLPTNITSYQLQEDTDFSNVNSSFLAATRYVSDSDVFNYTVENKGSTEVLGSGFEAPTISTTTRSNSEPYSTSSTAKVTGLSGPVTLVKNRLYLNPSWNSGDDWNKTTSTDVPKFAAYMKDGSGNIKYVPAKADSKNPGLYYVEYDSNYGSKIEWLRIEGTTFVDEVSYGSPSGINIWNSTGEINISSFNIQNGNNTTNVTGWNNSYNTNSTTNYTPTHTYNFNKNGMADSKGYIPMESITSGSTTGVTFQLEDMFAKNSGNTIPVIMDSRQYGGTGSYNVVSLQYGELATMNRQFTAMTNMRVTQLNALSAPSSGSRALNTASDNTGRTVSKYYDTYVKSQQNTGKLQMMPAAGIYNRNDINSQPLVHARDMYEQQSDNDYVLKTALASKNYSNNTVVNLQESRDDNSNIVTTFMLSDPEYPSDTNVSLRQVFINSVRTADLKLAKYMTGETPQEKSFTFTITFSQVFGSTDSTANGLVNISSLKYYLDDDTTTEYSFDSYDNSAKSVTFTLEPNHYITIKGIPVGTKYLINEAADNDYTLDADSSINLSIENGVIVATEITDDIDVDFFNKVKTGAIRLRKNLQNASGNPITSDEEFEYIVTVTSRPSRIGPVGSYPITAHLAGTPATKTSVVWEKDENNVYSLRVNVKPSDDSPYANDVILEGFPVGLVYNVTETAKDGYKQGAVSFSDNTKTVDNYYIGASGTTGSGESNDSTIDLIQVTNRVIPKGSLTITKAWKDSDGISDLSDERMTELNVGTSIGVVLYYSSNSGSTWQKAKDIDNTDVSDITLQSEDGWTQTITRLPTNYTYKIVEKNKNGNELVANEKYDNKFIVTYSSNVSLANDGSTGTLTVTNKNDPQQIVMPTTGGTPIIWLTPLGIIAVALAGAALVIYKKKLQGASLIREKKGEE